MTTRKLSLTMTTNTPFDQLSDRFNRNIYNTPKGKIRLALLQQDLAAQLASPGQVILDAGGGQGQLARWCAQQGHQLVLCDTSATMLDQARQMVEVEKLQSQFELIHSPIEAFCQQDTRQFDMVMCHAVLEWVTDPAELLAGLERRLKPGGCLSLMFYNRHSIVLRNALRGNFRKALSPNLNGDGSALTPINPCDPEQIETILTGLRLEIVERAGIRCFYDYLPIKVKQTYTFEDILEMECRFRHQAPYYQMARYIHLIAHKP
ncbi:MAG: methyltransferase domain-containing protein [Halopseudomonas sp.]